MSTIANTIRCIIDIREMKNIRSFILYFAWLQALIATAGSLYLSVVLKLTPCNLCWYQRILMYPLVLILAVGILTRDRRLPLYALPLSLLGLAVSAYHNLLYYHLLSESTTVCVSGTSCTLPLITFFGFLSVPLLSLIAFIVITSCLLLSRRP